MTKITDKEALDRFINAISLGSPLHLAAKAAGIDESTIHYWRKELQSGEKVSYREEKAKFFDDIKKAEGQAVAKWLSVIEEAAVKQWTAAAWKLERIHWKDFGVNVPMREMDERLKSIEERHKKDTSDAKEGEV